MFSQKYEMYAFLLVQLGIPSILLVQHNKYKLEKKYIIKNSTETNSFEWNKWGNSISLLWSLHIWWLIMWWMGKAYDKNGTSFTIVYRCYYLILKLILLFIIRTYIVLFFTNDYFIIFQQSPSPPKYATPTIFITRE